MYNRIFSDTNDVEGIIWWGNGGTQWDSRANGNLDSPIERMGGRPIGFRVWSGDHFDTSLIPPIQPLQVSIVYNGCNCPASTYIGDTPIQDMTIEAIVGPTQTQTVQYQKNYMEDVYLQDCGTYGIRYYPTYPFFSFSTSGSSTNQHGDVFPDIATFTAGTADDVGQYPVTMVVY